MLANAPFFYLLPVLRPPPPPPQQKKNGNDLVKDFYKDLNIRTWFQLKPTTEDIILKLLKKIDISKAADIDNLPGRF